MGKTLQVHIHVKKQLGKMEFSFPFSLLNIMLLVLTTLWSRTAALLPWPWLITTLYTILFCLIMYNHTTVRINTHLILLILILHIADQTPLIQGRRNNGRIYWQRIQIQTCKKETKKKRPINIFLFRSVTKHETTPLYQQNCSYFDLDSMDFVPVN